MRQQGLFITIEGGDGAGKTTVIGRMAAYFQNRSLPYLITREPGGIEIAEKIRHIILDPAHTAMDPRTEALLYAASRAQHLAERVEPALKEGMIVLCDRFVDSSLVYQGYARGLGMDQVWEINRFAIGDRMPDLTVYLDISPEEGLARINASGTREVNRLDLESMAFHERVREGYLLLAKAHPERIVTLAANRPVPVLEQELIRTLEARILKDL